MSARDPQAAAYRQLHDLRAVAREMARELETLQQAQRQLDQDITATRKHQTTSPRQRFARGLSWGVAAVMAVWCLALTVAHLTVSP